VKDITDDRSLISGLASSLRCMAISKPLWKSLANCGLTSNAAAAARFALKLDSAMASEKVLQG
jgi:hypothetical protein